ncbi:MAG TPA: 16S rRNA (adenine(1518)-N(6)/adenine(1519)-N(6))-dimethyltransferase RsmA [Phycisphaerae bacterium]|nr:16S rRNA (adenine(1518)-N(6)/adenine(1519)-N(6))-dimethyltransferase RsmA [Phycisphaerae bacterium]
MTPLQTMREIRQMLGAEGLAPHKRFGQNFLVDLNLMRKLLELADLEGSETVLEVGAGTGSLTEELLDRARSVVAVEIDRGLHALLERRLAGRENLTLICGDVLAGKHEISPAALSALPAAAHLVANLPYAIATPLLSECLLCSWRAAMGASGGPAVRFERMTFTVQREVADRLSARPGSKDYGPASVIVALLGRCVPGPMLPGPAFWPRPKVNSRMMRIDFDPTAAAELRSASALTAVLALGFGHRRKQIGWVLRDRRAPVDPQAFRAGLDRAGIAPTARAEQIAPEQLRELANTVYSAGPVRNAP